MVTPEQITTVEERDALLAVMSEALGGYQASAPIVSAVADAILAAGYRPDRPVAPVDHGPYLTWSNDGGPEHESNKCKCGLKWPHPDRPVGVSTERDALTRILEWCDPANAPTWTPENRLAEIEDAALAALGFEVTT